MPRGKAAKSQRVHNRACAAGRSPRGGSGTACNQVKGKKYRKGETSSHIEFQSIKTTYEGDYYDIHFRIVEGKISIGSVVKLMKNGHMSGRNQIQDNTIHDITLKDKICRPIFSNCFIVGNSLMMMSN
jgi:hypothetical protein